MVKCICEVCSKVYEVKPYRAKTSRFCGMACRGKVILNTLEANAKKGRPRELNGNWKGGKTKHSAGYILVLMPKHPFAHKHRGYVYEHRLIMEKKLGRYLKPSEQVHHINGDKRDNHINNLELLKDCSAHSRLHGVERGGINLSIEL